MSTEFNVFAGEKRVACLIPLERLDQVLELVRNCYPNDHINAYRLSHESAYHFSPKCAPDVPCEASPVDPLGTIPGTILVPVSH